VRRLIVTDIHSNWEALEAVAASAEGAWDEAICLGDIVGYCAAPREAIDWVRQRCTLIVRGNHDKAVCGLDDMEEFNAVAQAAASWTRDQVEADDLVWLAGLEAGPVERGGAEFAHGSPFDEDEYLVVAGDAEMLFLAYHHPLCFVGHSHLQGGFCGAGGRVLRLPRPHAHQPEVALPLEAGISYLVNPGSVGQPRDGDTRAAYAIWDDVENHILFRRVAYDIPRAMQRIHDAGLPPMLAERLGLGR
jgi:diadenosine tetraphosphatase ApaH/serine/threonine PP2A family protein phosphatase